MSSLHNPEIFRFFIDSDDSKFLYFPTIGIDKCNMNLYTEHVHLQSELIIKICNTMGLEFAVFAASSIGKVRSNIMMPWFDDYDIIVMDDHKEFFRDVVVPVLRTYGFRFWGWGTERRGEEAGLTFVSGRYFGDKAFRLDVFWSIFDNNDILKNVDGKGIYDKKNIGRDVVFPITFHEFHGIDNVPFFNDYEKEVDLSYGDVENECIIHAHAKAVKGINVEYDGWERAFQDFEYLIQRSISNTKGLFPNYSEYKSENKTMLLNGDYSSKIELFSRIINENIGVVNCTEPEFFMREAADISFYFPEIEMNLFLSNLDKIDYIFLNYATNVFVKNTEMSNMLNELIYVNKPIVKVAKIITFGTFDLFHMGHENILKRCSELSEDVIVGVSSDRLNEIKNKSSHDSIETRKSKVEKIDNVNSTFTEDSLDEKDAYIGKYGANLLVMGDDWKDEFNWVNCHVLYFPRTPGISSTQLKNNEDNDNP